MSERRVISPEELFGEDGRMFRGFGIEKVAGGEVVEFEVLRRIAAGKGLELTRFSARNPVFTYYLVHKPEAMVEEVEMGLLIFSNGEVWFDEAMGQKYDEIFGGGGNNNAAV